jgi:hypothetical protein
MELIIGSGTGTMCKSSDIEQCISNEPPISEETLRGISISVGVDPAYSADGSKFAITVVAVLDNKVHILDALEFSGLDFSGTVQKLFNLLSSKYNRDSSKRNYRIYVDSANPHYIRSCCTMVSQNSEYESDLEYARKNHFPPDNTMLIVPMHLQ